MRVRMPAKSAISFVAASVSAIALPAVLLVGLGGTRLAIAQAPAAATHIAPPKAVPHKSAPAHKRTVAKKKAPEAPVAPVVETPAAPPLPNWPVNDKPAAATVTWDSKGLQIDARNSSLQQILEAVATATGAKLEGFATDERVFGVYGPGQVRDVVSQLLHGSAYNVIMIGDQGQGTPRQIVLSTRHAGDTRQAANNNQPGSADEDADAEEPPQPTPPPIRPGFNPGGPPRTPQQLQQEMLLRQQQQNPHPPN